MLTTRYCPECARPITSDERRQIDRRCPTCNAALEADVDQRWINVARVTSLAEAGFLADELTGEGVDARIYRADQFNVLADRWTADYFIQTPPGDAPAAAARIRRHLADADPPYQPTGQHSWVDEGPAIGPVLWRPVALMVLAGVASFIVGQRFAAERDAARHPPRHSLSDAVHAIGRPLATEPTPGLPRHRLSFHGRQQLWYLETDANGDGRYETRRRFQATGAGR